MREFKLIGEKIDAAVSYFAGLEEMFTWQKDIFLKKLNADFEPVFVSGGCRGDL